MPTPKPDKLWQMVKDSPVSWKIAGGIISLLFAALIWWLAYWVRQTDGSIDTLQRTVQTKAEGLDQRIVGVEKDVVEVKANVTNLKSSVAELREEVKELGSSGERVEDKLGDLERLLIDRLPPKR